jgi:hypothetical protein
MKFNFYIFKQFFQGNLDVSNELTSFMMEDAKMDGIKAMLVRTCVKNEIINSHELVSANK